MKRLRKIDNNIIKVGIWSLKLTFIAVIWGVIVKFTDLSFTMELGTKTLDVTTQLILNGTFVAVVMLMIILLICVLLERIVSGLMKIKRRKLNSL